MKKNPLSQIQTFLIDLDGTVYLGDKLLPGFSDFFTFLTENKKKYFFLSNNSSESRIEYQKKLKRMGIRITKNQIITSAQTTIEYLKKRKYKKIFLLGTESLAQEFLQARFILTDKNPDAVVAGFDKTLTYKKLKKACLLIQEEVNYVATHADPVCPAEQGAIPDCGAILSFIKTATNKNPQAILGKPNKAMIKTALKKDKIEKTRVAMIGDRLSTDVKMGKKAGIISILITQGQKKETQRNPALKANFTFRSFQELTKKIKEGL